MNPVFTVSNELVEKFFHARRVEMSACWTHVPGARILLSTPPRSAWFGPLPPDTKAHQPSRIPQMIPLSHSRRLTFGTSSNTKMDCSKLLRIIGLQHHSQRCGMSELKYPPEKAVRTTQGHGLTPLSPALHEYCRPYEESFLQTSSLLGHDRLNNLSKWHRTCFRHALLGPI